MDPRHETIDPQHKALDPRPLDQKLGSRICCIWLISTSITSIIGLNCGIGLRP